MHLVTRIQVSQYVPRRRFTTKPVHFGLVTLLRSFFFVIVDERIGVLIALLQLLNQRYHGPLRDRHSIDLRADRIRQAIASRV